MPIAAALVKLKSDATQCEALIAEAHRNDTFGIPLFSQISREQITTTAFLNLYIAWEAYLEETLSNYMAGATSVTGRQLTKYVAPATAEKARLMLIANNRYFEYGNQEYVKKISELFFDNGHPFKQALNSITTELSDLKTMRNSAAHMSSSTRTQLEGVSNRIFGVPRPNQTLYSMITSIDPRSTARETVFLTYKGKLILAAEYIANA